MKASEVPQDERRFRNGESLHKLVYAVDKDGNYIGKVSAGWDPENTATQEAWNDLEQRLADTWAKMKAGQVSPIAYYMEKCLMDKALLAKYVGKWQWQISAHFKPEGFKKITPALLAKYAEVFGISVAELQEPAKP